ncbi:MAG: BspA family leucine-rich repeat surface protein [Chryseobacterium sp.]|jgi:surface protein|uniref:BspA family leucine-rich repeat surface protein n=1 Tax=Chryseobacterium sp. TaxID=1871047 RepID=UPI002824AA3F|nr:BspA family leucine-rich repeat surface protein [Chryseobacterium sp.]MDR2238204.1 BspA family leucine-rich repeat surface protein [Chryseobacterium sp.]
MYKKNLLAAILFILLFQLTKAQNEFITVWNPSLPSAGQGTPGSSGNTQIWFPGTGTDYTIYWEEIGYPSHHATLTNVTSQYQILIDFGTPLNPEPAQATYRIKVSNGNGNFQRIAFSNADVPPGITILGDNFKILKVEQWGNISWSSMAGAFYECRALDVTATDIPDLSNATNMSYMFANCFNLTGNPTINNWDISHITSLVGTFSGCFLFNQPIGGWDTSNVTMMEVMFMLAMKFNQPIGNWNTSKVVTTTAMFQNAQTFNQPVGNWDMSKNTDAELMFANAAQFNQPIGSWNTSQIVEMNFMFFNAKAFNQNISNWDTGNVKYMDGMFFSAEKFNSDITNWNVSKVERMQNMFNNAKIFNQNVGKWDVKSVKNMTSMFDNATDFNQSLGEWELNSLQFAANMLRNTAITCQNYDETLFGWSQNPLVASNIDLSSVSPLVYSGTNAVSARNFLMSNKSWIISGDTYDGECSPKLSTSDLKMNQKKPLYPNPARDIIYIRIPHTESYTIYDLSGRVVSKGSLTDQHINIQSLTPGNYLLQLRTKENIQNLKFTKQ